jgi:hypothetical protein
MKVKLNPLSMARRRTSKKRRTSRKKQGVSILGVAETVMLLNVASQAAFNTSAYTFLTSKFESGTNTISLAEILQPMSSSGAARFGAGFSPSDRIMQNFKNNWISATGMMIAIPIGFKFAKKLGQPAISRTNKLLNKAGVGSTVKL